MNTVVIGWIGAVLGLAGFALAQAVYSWESYRVRRYHARFPMFAARDEMVRLVAEGAMDEDDPAWALAYTGCNIWLSPRTSHSIWSDLSTRLRDARARRKDPKAAERLERLKHVLVQRAVAIPAFGSAIIQSDDARRRLMRGRTHWWDRVAFRLLYTIAFAIAAGFLAGEWIARVLGRKKPAQKSRAEAERFVPLHPSAIYSTSRSGERPVDIEASIGEFVAWNTPSSWKSGTRERHVTVS